MTKTIRTNQLTRRSLLGGALKLGGGAAVAAAARLALFRKVLRSRVIRSGPPFQHVRRGMMCCEPKLWDSKAGVKERVWG
jgi:hypothetical protein